MRGDKTMAKQISLGLTSEQASAEATQIVNYYGKIDDLGKQASSLMLRVAPLLKNLKATNGWLHLDNYSSVDGSHDHKSFCKWCEDYFDKSHSTMAETIAVADRFFSDNGTLLNADFADYGYTQLLRMRKLTDDEISELGINPDMSSADIKRMVVDYKKPAITKKDDGATQEVPTMAIPENLKELLTDVEVPMDETPTEPEPETPEEIVFKVEDFNEEFQNVLNGLMEKYGVDYLVIEK